MSLDVYLEKVEPCEVYSDNITHNLNVMAKEAGLYFALWRPDEVGLTRAKELIPLLTDGLYKLIEDPERFKAMNPINGWGDYDGLVAFVSEYLKACIANPDARVRVSR